MLQVLRFQRAASVRCALAGQAGAKWPASRSLGEVWSPGKVLPLRLLGVGQT